MRQAKTTPKTELRREQTMKLKKIWTVCLTAALLLSVGATGAFAARFGQGQGDCKRDCLSKETCTSACRFADEDGDGLCDLCVRAAGDACRFADEDGDGWCDSRAAGTRPQDGTGCRQGGRGHCGR